MYVSRQIMFSFVGNMDMQKLAYDKKKLNRKNAPTKPLCGSAGAVKHPLGLNLKTREEHNENTTFRIHL